MSAFEYKVVPAPAKGTKAKGVKTAEARFANSVEITLNQMAAEGWEYLRAELLPSEERAGLTGSTTNWRNVLIFRRALTVAPAQAAPIETPVAVPSPVAAPAPMAAAATPAPEAPAEEPEANLAIAGDPEADPNAASAPGAGATHMLKDNGVEEVSPVAGFTAALKRRASQRTEDGS